MECFQIISMIVSVIAVVIAGISLFISWKQYKQNKNRSEFDKKIELKGNLDEFFENLKGYCPAICELHVGNIESRFNYWDRKETLLFQVKKIFGESIEKDLNKIFELYETMSDLNNQIKQLLNLLEQEDREKLGEILEKEYQTDFDEYSKEDLDYQKRIEIKLVSQGEYSDDDKYNFYDLKSKWENNYNELCEQIDKFNIELEATIKFN